MLYIIIPAIVIWFLLVLIEPIKNNTSNYFPEDSDEVNT